MGNRAPRLVEVRRWKAPESVRVAPAPDLSRALPRLEWASVGGGWEEAAWLEGGESDSTLAMALGTNRGAEPELCGGASPSGSPWSGNVGAR